MLDWAQDLEAVEDAMRRFHIKSGTCAALARVVKPRAAARFGHARGIQILPEEGAVYLVPKDSSKAR